MAINWEGFIQGVSDYGLERLKEERAMKMKQKLAELEEKHKIAAEDREYNKKKKEVKGTRDVAGSPGMVEDVNMEGTVLGQRALDEWSRTQRDQSTAKYEADIKNIDSQIKARTDDAAIARERNAIAREGNSIASQAARGSSPTDDPLFDPVSYGAERLLGNLDLSKTGEAIKPKHRAKLAQLARNAVIRAPSFGAAQEMFLQELSTLDLDD